MIKDVIVWTILYFRKGGSVMHVKLVFADLALCKPLSRVYHGLICKSQFIHNSIPIRLLK